MFRDAPFLLQLARFSCPEPRVSHSLEPANVNSDGWFHRSGGCAMTKLLRFRYKFAIATAGSPQ